MGAFIRKRSPVLGLLLALVVLFGSMTVLLRGQRMAVSPMDSSLLAPDFHLTDTTGNSIQLSNLRGKTVVALFSSSREPNALAYDHRFCELARQYSNDPRVQFLAIHSQPGMSGTRAREIRVQAQSVGRTFPTLLDSTGQVATQYAIPVKPFVFVIDANGMVQYSGAFDDNIDPTQVSKHFCADALRQCLDGSPITIAQH